MSDDEGGGRTGAVPIAEKVDPRDLPGLLTRSVEVTEGHALVVLGPGGAREFGAGTVRFGPLRGQPASAPVFFVDRTPVALRVRLTDLHTADGVQVAAHVSVVCRVDSAARLARAAWANGGRLDPEWCARRLAVALTPPAAAQACRYDAAALSGGSAAPETLIGVLRPAAVDALRGLGLAPTEMRLLAILPAEEDRRHRAAEEALERKVRAAEVRDKIARAGSDREVEEIVRELARQEPSAGPLDEELVRHVAGERAAALRRDQDVLGLKEAASRRLGPETVRDLLHVSSALIPLVLGLFGYRRFPELLRDALQYAGLRPDLALPLLLGITGGIGVLAFLAIRARWAGPAPRFEVVDDRGGEGGGQRGKRAYDAHSVAQHIAAPLRVAEGNLAAAAKDAFGYDVDLATLVRLQKETVDATAKEVAYAAHGLAARAEDRGAGEETVRLGEEALRQAEEIAALSHAVAESAGAGAGAEAAEACANLKAACRELRDTLTHWAASA